jgi:hypothetical protein
MSGNQTRQYLLYIPEGYQSSPGFPFLWVNDDILTGDGDNRSEQSSGQK